MGAFPLAAFLISRRHSDPSHPRAMASALAVAAGACAWVLIDLWCPVAYLPHLLLGHVLPMVALAVIGALLGRRIVGLR